MREAIPTLYTVHHQKQFCINMKVVSHFNVFIYCGGQKMSHFAHVTYFPLSNNIYKT